MNEERREEKKKVKFDALDKRKLSEMCLKSQFVLTELCRQSAQTAQRQRLGVAIVDVANQRFVAFHLFDTRTIPRVVHSELSEQQIILCETMSEREKEKMQQKTLTGRTDCNKGKPATSY